MQTDLARKQNIGDKPIMSKTEHHKEPLKFKRLLIGLCIAISVYVLAVVGVYIFFLGSLPVATHDPGAWGQFGDYIGGLLNPLFALFNIAVVVYIAIAVQRLSESERRREEQSQERIQTILDLHREWNSESIYRSRNLAGSLVRKFPKSTLLDIENGVDQQDAAHVWIVINFFLRLGYLVQHEKIHAEMTIDLFGELFVWWWVVSFERQLMPVDWDARDQVASFKDWLFANTTEERRKQWLKRAIRDLEVAENRFAAIMTKPAP